MTDAEILRGVFNRRVHDLIAWEANRARSYYDEARRLLPAEDAWSLRAAEVMRRTYAEILDRIVAADYFVFGDRLSLSKARKLQLAASLWLSPRFA